MPPTDLIDRLAPYTNCNSSLISLGLSHFRTFKVGSNDHILLSLYLITKTLSVVAWLAVPFFSLLKAAFAGNGQFGIQFSQTLPVKHMAETASVVSKW